MGIEVQGAEKAMQELRKLTKKYPEATALALYTEGFRTQREAMILTPREFGFLESGAYTAPPRREGGRYVVEVGYGAIYARRQHEETTWRHPRKGEAKFLEKAFNKNLVGFAERMGKRIRQAVESGEGLPPTKLGRTQPGPSQPPRRPGKGKGKGLKRSKRGKRGRR